MMNRRREKVEALILSRRNIGEADRLVTFFTRECGVLRVIANGVRKIPSRRGGHLEPFTRVLAVVSFNRQKYYLAGVETADVYPKLQQSQEAMLNARNLSLIIGGFFDENDPQPGIFDALHDAWQILPELTDEKRASLETALSLYILQYAGVMPELSACRLCGVEKPTESVILDPQEGMWHCLLCHGGFTGADRSLPPHLLKVLRFLSVYPKKALQLRLEREDSVQLLNSLRDYISYVIKQPVLNRQW